MKRTRNQEIQTKIKVKTDEEIMLAIRTALGQGMTVSSLSLFLCLPSIEDEHDRSKQAVVLYRINETEHSNNTFIRAYWPKDKRKGEQLLAYLHEFLDIEIEMQIRHVDPLAFINRKILQPTVTGRYKAPIVDVYHHLTSIPDNRIAVVEIFLR